MRTSRLRYLHHYLAELSLSAGTNHLCYRLVSNIRPKVFELTKLSSVSRVQLNKFLWGNTALEDSLGPQKRRPRFHTRKAIWNIAEVSSRVFSGVIGKTKLIKR